MSKRGFFLVLWWLAHLVSSVILIVWSMGWAMLVLDSPVPRETPIGLMLFGWFTVPFYLPLTWPLGRLLLALGYADPTQPIYWALPPINSLAVVWIGWLIYNRVRRGKHANLAA